ncbi:MAG: hypothetical protein H0X42_04325 [Solirubrobacterales bacterium]|nr:hypothetical protein [Solirubrobacterales bacterium]
MKRTCSLIWAVAASAALVAGCGSSGSSGSSAGTTTHLSATAGAGAEAGNETAPTEAQSLATGDIPDNQVFLLFKDPKADYSMRYPEGWARTGTAADVTFAEKANVIHVVVHKGPPPSEASAVGGVEALHKGDPTVKGQAPEMINLAGQPVVKVSYSRLSRPDPVTGKRVRLLVDRYEYAHAGKVAVLDLATPVGVDNVDAYRMISESLKWLR